MTEQPTTQTLRQKLLGGDPRVITDPATIGEAKGVVTDIKNKLLAIDPDFDQSGVQDFWFRAGLSRMDTNEEREAYLTRTAGPSGWTKDRYGKYALTVSGMDKRGYQHKGKPTVIDEPEPAWNDIADFAGEAPAMAGAAGAGMAATGAGFVPGVAAATGGAILGKGLDELIESLTGQNRQSLGEVAKDVALVGAEAGAGEGFFRGLLRPLGRKLMAPEAKRMTPESAALADEARSIGARPNISQISHPPLLGRTQSMMNRIFGDPLAVQNSKALNAEVDRLKSAYGPGLGDTETGEAVVKGITQGRKALSRWSETVTGKIDEATGGQAVVPTATFKAEAREISKSLPQTASGDTAFTPADLKKSLAEAVDLPEYVTISQMQAISSKLFEAIDDSTIVPGITGRNARLLWGASRDTFADIADPQIRDMTLAFHRKYAENIKLFDNALISRITKNPQLAGKIEPEVLVSSVFRKGNAANIFRLQKATTPGAFEKFQRAAMDDLVSNISARTDDPLREVFTGKAFLSTLDRYGKDTLNAAFGPQVTGELYRLGKVTSLVTQRQALSGGLVAAHIALHPLRNLGRLTQLNILSRFLNTPFAVRWFTEGLKAPNTRMGAESISRATVFMLALAEQGTTADVAPDRSRPTEAGPQQPAAQ